MLEGLVCRLLGHAMRFTVDGRFYCRRCGLDRSDEFSRDVRELVARLVKEGRL